MPENHSNSNSSPLEDFLRDNSETNVVIRRRSPTQREVLACLACGTCLNNPSYAYQIMQCRGIRTGTLYPILDRLVESGALERTWEDEDGRSREPRRVYYDFTALIPQMVIEQSREADCPMADPTRGE